MGAPVAGQAINKPRLALSKDLWQIAQLQYYLLQRSLSTFYHWNNLLSWQNLLAARLQNSCPILSILAPLWRVRVETWRSCVRLRQCHCPHSGSLHSTILVRNTLLTPCGGINRSLYSWGFWHWSPLNDPIASNRKWLREKSNSLLARNRVPHCFRT